MSAQKQKQPPIPVPPLGEAKAPKITMQQWHKMTAEEKDAYRAAKEAAKGPPKVQVRKQVATLATKVLQVKEMFSAKDNDTQAFLSAAYARLLEACEEIDELPKDWKPATAKPKSDKLAVGDTVVIIDKGKQRFATFFDAKALDGEHQITAVETSPSRCQVMLAGGSYFWFPSNVLQRTRKVGE